MAISAGTRLGPYEILAPIGAGGMGEVYRARDTRLDRTVAIKVLPQDLSKRPELRERFEREARAVSSLNHPNICTLHDVGRQDGVDFLVMEHIEGETIAARLEKGPLPLESLLRIAAEIASALDRAHRSGVIHRDLKPSNIMLTKSGAKLLDFGLARVRKMESPAAGLSTLRTENRDLTGEGTILGTFQYMAPEQLEGKEADARTDLFALGAVLYEMVTGKRPFSGKSQASLIASILAAEPPPISSLQPMSPPALERVVRTCLAKDPDDRWQTAHDVMLQLRWIADGGSQAGVPAPVAARRRGRESLAWIAAGALLVTTSVATVAWVRRAPTSIGTIRLQVLPPEKTSFNTLDGPVTISPDGRRMIFSASEDNGEDSLWVRDLDVVAARKLGGTGGAYDPFWSPDSRSIAFGNEGGLVKIDVAGGPVQKVCDMPDGRGGTWSRDNVILFVKTGASPIFKVPASGGQPVEVTRLDASRHETGHWRPRFLPDGKRFVYLVRSSEPENEGAYIGSIESTEKTRILDGPMAATPALPGYLLYIRDKILMAQPFDFAHVRMKADASPVATDLEYVQTWGTSSFSVSDNGTLAVQSPVRRTRQLFWVDRTGKQIGSVGQPAEYRDDPRLSRDGRFAAVVRVDPENRGRDIWLMDLARGVMSRLTSDPGVDESPVWSPDGTRIAFMSNRAGMADLYVKLANGSGSEEVLLRSDRWKRPMDWSPDGRFLLYGINDPKTGDDLWLLPMTGDRKPQPLLTSSFQENQGRFSPDGKWLGYVSSETGRHEVFVQPFPPTGSKWQVSTNGADGFAWSNGGKEIVMGQASGITMVAEIRTSPAFEAGVPKELFRNALIRGIDVAADGQRVLVTLPQGDAAISPITVVLNWTADLKP